MIRDILNVDTVKILTKEEQCTILGGTKFINCVKFVHNSNIYVECYDTEEERYVIHNLLGKEVKCDELFDH
ncbi:MAG: hypothetical protein AAF611_15830 [Bacteroidota bacterium]